MGAWIEISDGVVNRDGVFVSHPTMGAWIEILFSFTPNFNEASRTPRWVRGLKYVMWMYLL